MVDVEHIKSRWVCPDDRQLILRSRLKTGWSYWTAEQESLTQSPRRVGNASTCEISREEEEIVNEVLRRAAAIDREEEDRIGRLVVRLEQLKKTSCVGGESKCAVCGERLGLLSRPSTVCKGCGKGVCQSCSAKTSDSDSVPHVLCKICLEEYEMWKKTGAWFYKMLPQYTRPSNRSRPNSTCATPERLVRSWGSHEDVTSFDETDGPIGLDTSHHSQFLSPHRFRVGSRERLNRSTPCLAHQDSDVSISMSLEKRRGLREDVSHRSNKVSQTSFSASMDGQLHSSQRSPIFSDRVGTLGLFKAAQQARRFSLSHEGSNDKCMSEDNDSLASPVLENYPVDPRNRCRAHVERNSHGERVKGFGKGRRNYRNASDEVEADEEEDVDKVLEQVLNYPNQSDESLSDITSHEKDSVHPSSGLSKGSIHFSLMYNSDECELRLQLLTCKSLSIPDHSGPLNPYVKMDVIPSPGKSRLIKSAVIQKNASPNFNQLITYPGILESDIKHKSLRLSVMHAGRLGHDLAVGETRVPLKKLQPGREELMDHVLQKLSVIAHDTVTDDERGVIQLSLEYRTDKNQLVVGILQAAGLAPMDSNGLSDPYVKCYLRPDPHKKSKHKTHVFKKTLNPVFNKEFVYDMKPTDLAKKVLEVTVWDHDLGRNDYIGGIRLSKEAKGDLLAQWYSVLTKPNEQFIKWHKLSPNPFVEK